MNINFICYLQGCLFSQQHSSSHCMTTVWDRSFKHVYSNPTVPTPTVLEQILICAGESSHSTMAASASVQESVETTYVTLEIHVCNCFEEHNKNISMRMYIHSEIPFFILSLKGGPLNTRSLDILDTCNIIA